MGTENIRQDVSEPLIGAQYPPILRPSIHYFPIRTTASPPNWSALTALVVLLHGQPGIAK